MQIVTSLISLAIMVVVIAGIWKVFEKAGHPGWAAIVPFYNLYVLTQIAGKPAWWMVLFLIPVVNFIVAIILALAIAERFGKTPAFGIGLALLGPVFYPMLGFGDAQYRKA